MKFNLFKSEFIEDSYFGKMGLEYDKDSKKYFMNKDIEIINIQTPIILYIESTEKKLSISHQKNYEKIIHSFNMSWNSIIELLTEIVKLISVNELSEKYRIESITISQTSNLETAFWEIDLLNLEDEFSRIVVEMKDNESMNYSIEG